MNDELGVCDLVFEFALIGLLGVALDDFGEGF